MTPEHVGAMTLSFLGWSVAGILALFLARLAYTLFTPFDPHKELVDDQNAAVGASHGMYVVAAAIILHGLIVGEKMAVEWWQEYLYMFALYIAGLFFLWLGRVALRAAVKFDLDEEIHVNDNLAVGILEGCSYLGFAIIVHAAI